MKIKKNSISKKILPYKGYDEGYNVILYDDKTHSMEQAVDDIMEICGEDLYYALEVCNVVSKEGFIVIDNFGDDVFMADQFAKCFTSRGYQCEVFLGYGENYLEEN